MDFSLDDEQRALQDAVRSYLGDRFTGAQVRELYENDPDDATDGVPAALWKAIGEQGWLAVMVPEEHDGIGLGVLDASVLSRAFGAGTVPGPWLGTVLVGEALRLAGSPEQQAAWLPRIAAGEVKGAVALLTPNSTPSVEHAPAQAADGSLSGTLSYVEYAGTADVLLVAAQDGLYLVEPGAFTSTAHDSLDRTVRLFTVELSGPAEKLGASTPEAHAELLDRATVLVAADLVGMARKALSDTVAYDKERVQFGRPVGSFQAIKHHLADLHVNVTMAEHAVLFAAHALDLGDPDAPLAASIAKAKASDTARESVSAMIQYHGGIGYTWEHDSHFYFKRAKRQEYSFGDGALHRERVAVLTLDQGGLDDEPIDSVQTGSAAGVEGTGIAAGAA